MKVSSEQHAFSEKVGVQNFISEKVKGLQSGQLQQYAYVMVSGMIIIVLLVIFIFN